MKKNCYILLLFLLSLAACKEKAPEGVTLAGEIKGLGADTLYLYGMDGEYDHIDTLFAENDKFTRHIEVDTLVCAYLLIGKQTEYPLFLDKGNKITIKGDMANPASLSVDGNIYNEEYTAFCKEVEGFGVSPSDTIVEGKAEEFIRQHHSSYVSLYLLDRYFVRKATPDLAKIKELTELMTGVLQDRPYIGQLNELISQMEREEVGKYAPHFTLANAEGEKISRTSERFKDKCLLICFWASWADSTDNQRNNMELRSLYKTYKKDKYFGMLGVSLDMDKEEWLSTVERDTLEWEQVCAPDGLNSEVAKQYSLHPLPYNVLVASDGKIVGKNLRGEELRTLVKEEAEKTEKKIKERKEKERKEKAKKKG